MIPQTLKWVGGLDGFLELIDQRQLPCEFVKIQCRDIKQVYHAIKTLTVRGAPAIGVSAAYGLVLAMQKLHESSEPEQGFSVLVKSCEYLASSRPTAVNLFWALDRVKQKAQRFIAEKQRTNLHRLWEVVLNEANAICQEDVDMCRRIGENGDKLIKHGAGILTHCNAGALATAGQGTALSVLFEAHKKNKKFKVYVDETRPLLQGARLTAWELKQAGIDTTVICDSAAGWLMKQGKIKVVIIGADRIAANGDTANKIGTYSLSILAKEHGISFYIAAPSNTFDLNIKSGVEIPIELRSDDEVRFLDNKKLTADNVDIYNPAFDITEAQHITAIITEKGIIEKPTAEKIAMHLQ